MASNSSTRETHTRSPWLSSFYWLVIFITFVPIIVMVLYSFNNSPTSRITFSWYGFTTYWYRNLTQVDGLSHAFVTSLEVAVISSVVSVIIGTPLSMALGRYKFWGKGFLSSMVFADIAAPAIVVGAASLSFFLSINLDTGLLTILIAHIAFNVAYVVVVVRARLSGMDSSIEDAARDLGAGPLTTFTRITLPLLWPALLAAGLLAFAMSIDDYVITSFVAGSTVTFPLFVYGAAKVGLPPQVLCFGTIIFFVGLLLALANGVLNRRHLAARAATEDDALAVVPLRDLVEDEPVSV
ncbi:MAG: ABC transporter permease subunit [Acidimicrobiales bacterium]|jgi:spermidine/putrescine transport system permease protein